MKFSFRKILLPLDMGDYDEAARGQILHVWVNPPREMKLERDGLVREQSRILAEMVAKAPAEEVPNPAPQKRGLASVLAFFRRPLEAHEFDAFAASNDKIFGWTSVILSQHEDASTHVSAEDLRTAYDADPALYRWMTRRTIELIEGFRTDTKKA